MKKKFKKLSLSTETLRHLSDPGLEQVAGAQTVNISDGATKCITIACTLCTANCTLCTRGCSECVTCVPCGA